MDKLHIVLWLMLAVLIAIGIYLLFFAQPTRPAFNVLADIIFA
ncbi:hypothetical protein ACFX5Q_29375 [Mesorhizobium sp. IMUNJ 23033]